ncbi:hypothetical protein ABK040_007192 [Willaertia magna]
MKIYSLGESCHVLTFKNTSILLDCSMDWGNEFFKRNPIPAGFSKSKENLTTNKTSRLNYNSLNNLQEYNPSVIFQIPNFYKFDMSQIDVVLISNPLNMLALPYLYKHLKEIKCNKLPIIYSTEPTMQLGKKMMLELYFNVKQSEHLELTNLNQIFKKDSNQLNNKLNELKLNTNEKLIYSEDDIYKVIEAVKTVSYQERIQVFGGIFQISALSSGYSLGYCNWLIQTEYEKILYVSHSSRSGAQIRHPSELDLGINSNNLNTVSTNVVNASSSTQQVSLSGGSSMTNVLIILSNISPISERNIYYYLQQFPQATNQMGIIPNQALINPLFSRDYITVVSPLHHYIPELILNEFCKGIGTIIENGGDVLIPCHMSGLIYDLIDFLYTYLQSRNLGNTLFYMISPIADHAIQYANISAEWLCNTKVDKTLTAESPFSHMTLLQNKVLMLFESVNSKFMQVYQQNRTSHPCIVFAGHPSLRMGDILQLIPIFQRNINNALVYIEPDYNFIESITPFVNLIPPNAPSMKFIYCPIDLRLKNSDIMYMMKQTNPQHLILTNVGMDLPLPQLQQQQMNRSYTPSSELIHALNGVSTTSSLLNALDFRMISKFVTEKIHAISHCSEDFTKNSGDDFLAIKKQHLKRKFELATITPELSQTIYPKVMKGVYVGRITAELNAKDGKYILDKFKEENTTIQEENDDQQNEKDTDLKKRKVSSQKQERMLFGDVSVEKIVLKLQAEGFDDIFVTAPNSQIHGYGTYTIDIPALSSKIVFNAEDTLIEAPNESTRKYLKEILMQNLYML